MTSGVFCGDASQHLVLAVSGAGGDSPSSANLAHEQQRSIEDMRRPSSAMLAQKQRTRSRPTTPLTPVSQFERRLQLRWVMFACDVCVYVCMCVCMYVRTHVRMYVCMYVCMCMYVCVEING